MHREQRRAGDRIERAAAAMSRTNRAGMRETAPFGAAT
jgi:hypothetical protein